MSEHDKGLVDRVKDALGMGDGDTDEQRRDDDRQPIDMETGGGGDLGVGRDEPIGGMSGAPEASGRVGATGGTGASAAMGGAGAGGPIGDEPLTDPVESRGAVDEGAVRTEYEMGNEYDPDHEKVAESGLFAERSGTADNDTWRDDASAWQSETDAQTRGEAAPGESSFDRDERTDR